MKQQIFILVLIITLAVFAWTVRRFVHYFRLTKPYPVRDFGKRFLIMMKVAFFQSKIFRFPFIGLMHALVFWGFLVICIGSLEIVIDGVTGTKSAFSSFGFIYNLITGSGDLFALIVLIALLVFFYRRLVMKVKRFEGVEMKKISHLDALVSLSLIFLLMVSLLGMNTLGLSLKGSAAKGYYPVSRYLTGLFTGMTTGHQEFLLQLNWWSHILMVFFFANYLPYSKHFHVFMSIPNVFLSRLEPLGKLYNMEDITREVKLMLGTAPMNEDHPHPSEVKRFGVLDANDVTWKTYLDSLACTECGRCTSVCPASATGKLLSPRKVMMDLRARLKELGTATLANGKNYHDARSLIDNYTSAEEIWACTTCNACAKECPININHPSLIVDMRRYLVMEKSSAPTGLNAIFANIENNGSPWQITFHDRMKWADGIDHVPVMAELAARNEQPEFLFWVGCAGSFDDRVKKVAKAFARILNKLNISYAVLGIEETCNGDPARRSGNEMLFQMQALTVIDTLKRYKVTKIITICPHCYNIFKNEYPDLDGHFEVFHHSMFLRDLIDKGILKINGSVCGEKPVTYHDPCYLGRANSEYHASRQVLSALQTDMNEMRRNKSSSFCCGGGGGQFFKETDKGDKEIFIERIEEVIATGAEIVATACPFCMTMLTDGIKYKNKEDVMRNYDIAELVAMAIID
ncbi:MAG: heterodisulfide reductase-related iron-sulfur binding cluster [Bacteroidia bacterium]|nr:heterodisulfide reductase-related iron-sulfur binding cluster [Bacteroidia bacterium]